MTMEHNRVICPDGWREIPLPGFYPCLTWQLNVTVHQQSGLGKFVSVIREPSDHIEVMRCHAELTEWPGLLVPLDMHLGEARRALGYLSGLTNGT